MHLKDEKRQVVKLKTLYLAKIFFEYTDQNNALSVDEVKDLLKKYDITIDRTSFYRDVRALNDFGLQIEKTHSRPERYFLASRVFSSEDIQLLLDAIWTMKFLSHDEAATLDKKIRKLGSIHATNTLSAGFDIPLRRRSNAPYAPTQSLRSIQNALRENKNISFKYMDFNDKGKRVERKDDLLRTVVPVALTLSEGNYYLIGFAKDNFDRDNECISDLPLRHYRIDRMERVAHLQDTSECERAKREDFKKHELQAHLKHAYFGMYQAPIKHVTLAISHDNGFNILYDKFGFKGDDGSLKTPHEMVISHDNAGFHASIRVPLSDIFFGWLASVYPVISLKAPQEALDTYREFLEMRIQKL